MVYIVYNIKHKGGFSMKAYVIERKADKSYEGIEGQVVLVGDKKLRRIVYKGENEGLYVVLKKQRKYLSVIAGDLVWTDAFSDTARDIVTIKKQRAKSIVFTDPMIIGA